MEWLTKKAYAMNIQDLRLYLLNIITLGISFNAIENSLKILLLLASIVYTFQKIYETYKKKNANNKKL